MIVSLPVNMFPLPSPFTLIPFVHPDESHLSQLSTEAGHLPSTFMGCQSLTIEFHRKKERNGERIIFEESENSIFFWAFSFQKWIKPEYVSNCFSSEYSWSRVQSGPRDGHHMSFVSVSETSGPSWTTPYNFPVCCGQFERLHH